MFQLFSEEKHRKIFKLLRNCVSRTLDSEKRLVNEKKSKKIQESSLLTSHTDLSPERQSCSYSYDPPLQFSYKSKISPSLIFSSSATAPCNNILLDNPQGSIHVSYILRWHVHKVKERKKDKKKVQVTRCSTMRETVLHNET